VQPAQLMTSSEVNTEQLLAYKKIVMTSDALAQLAERTTK
jgi:ribosomal protein L4